MTERQMNNMKVFFQDQALILRREIWEIAARIGENPELGYQEVYALELLSSFLHTHGFMVESGTAGIDTAFVARFHGRHDGPRIAFLAEYDALPEIGHGCGHNLIGAASAGAAAVLSKSMELPGEIWVIGTPAEETSGAKVRLVEAGVFRGVDAVMMFHPGSQNVAMIRTLALDALEFTFTGRAAHAAAGGKYGISALDALISFFVEVNSLKKQVPDGYVHGIITEGGITPNIIPERAVARFYLRADRREQLNKICRQVTACAREAAVRFSADVCWRKFEASYEEMRSNEVLAKCFKQNLQLMGIEVESQGQMAMGSVDMGDVSKVVPAIHPYLLLGKGTEIPHTREFARAAISQEAEKVLDLAVKALALTGWDILSNERILAKIQQEFRRRR